MPSSIALRTFCGTVSGMAENTQVKIRENRLRNAARRQGLRLVKSRTRDERALSFGTYWLLDAPSSAVEVGGDNGTDLDAIEAALLNGPATAK
jgi:hypothetical protein